LQESEISQYNQIWVTCKKCFNQWIFSSETTGQLLENMILFFAINILLENTMLFFAINILLENTMLFFAINILLENTMLFFAINTLLENLLNLFYLLKLQVTRMQNQERD
jgi:hypothetical protein